jgi:hypothetical protein
MEYEVIIPVRNGGTALANSIRSVLTHPPGISVFLTISDNFSTDGSPWKAALKQFPQEQWRIISPPQPLGRVEHWSWAFAQGNAAWIKPLMTGDRVGPLFWMWAETVLREFPLTGMLICGAVTIDPRRANPENEKLDIEACATMLYGPKEFSHDAVNCLNNVGALSQILVRRDVFESALPFEPRFSWTADWRLYWKCIQIKPAAKTDARLVCLDRSISRLSTSWGAMKTSLIEDWRFSAEHAELLGMPSTKTLLARIKVLGHRFAFSLARKLLPRSFRKLLGKMSNPREQRNQPA